MTDKDLIHFLFPGLPQPAAKEETAADQADAGEETTLKHGSHDQSTHGQRGGAGGDSGTDNPLEANARRVAGGQAKPGQGVSSKPVGPGGGWGKPAGDKGPGPLAARFDRERDRAGNELSMISSNIAQRRKKKDPDWADVGDLEEIANNLEQAVASTQGRDYTPPGRSGKRTSAEAYTHHADRARRAAVQLRSYLNKASAGPDTHWGHIGSMRALADNLKTAADFALQREE